MPGGHSGPAGPSLERNAPVREHLRAVPGLQRKGGYGKNAATKRPPAGNFHPGGTLLHRRVEGTDEDGRRGRKAMLPGASLLAMPLPPARNLLELFPSRPPPCYCPECGAPCRIRVRLESSIVSRTSTAPWVWVSTPALFFAPIAFAGTVTRAFSFWLRVT